MLYLQWEVSHTQRCEAVTSQSVTLDTSDSFTGTPTEAGRTNMRIFPYTSASPTETLEEAEAKHPDVN